MVVASLLAGATRGEVAPAPRRVLLYAPEADDGRIAAVRAAVSHWNRTFVDIGLAEPLAPPEVVAFPPWIRSLENYAWQLSRSAGRLVPGAPGPPPPAELRALEADVVILLSRQKVMPFAWPWTNAPRRHFVGLPTGSKTAAGETRDIVAHELGHVLGLTHDRANPDGLMCQPCQSSNGSGEGFRPLSERDRSRLLALYGSER